MLTQRKLSKVFRAASAVCRDPRMRNKPRRVKAAFALVRCMNPAERCFRHLMLVTRHKWYVFVYCAYAGHPWRGLMHDWSKFSPAEFWGSVRYFNGRRSPVGLCRDVEGYSFGWLHHKGRNKHHYEFWIDIVDTNGNRPTQPGVFYPIPMPFEYALESVCDTIAASRAYNGKKFSYAVLYKWWINSRKYAPVNMHPKTKLFVDRMYKKMLADGNCSALRDARAIYDQAQIDAEALGCLDDIAPLAGPEPEIK